MLERPIENAEDLAKQTEVIFTIKIPQNKLDQLEFIYIYIFPKSITTK